MNTDRELLELAAKAAAVDLSGWYLSLGVPEYQERLANEAMQAVENCASGDILLTAAMVLMFDVRRLRRALEDSKTLTNGEAVSIPTSADEAVLMVRLGMQYLRDHAPDRLAAETPNATNEPPAGSASITELG